MVYDRHASVRGIYWLTEHVLRADAFRCSRREEDKFFEPLNLEELLQRLLSSADTLARRDAAFLMSRLLWYQPDHPLWRMENVIITPHVAGYAPRIPQRHLEVVLDNVGRFARQEPLRNVVNKALWF